MTIATPPATIPASLTRQLLQLHHPNQRYNNDAITASSELLRLLIIEARRRAAIEAECESEVRRLRIDDDGDSSPSQSSKVMDDHSHQRRKKDKKKRVVVEIRADHIAKIAAELLMDLS